MIRYATAFFPPLALLLAAAPACAQDVVEPEQLPPATPLPDPLALARGAALRGDAAEALSLYLRALSRDARDLEALTGAGRASLDLDDPQSAIAFYARAEEVAPRNGRVKAGLGAAMVAQRNPRAALRFFGDAIEQGVPITDIAADRGLAYDLRGDTRRAQADYRLALAKRDDPETVRRLALSQAIAGARDDALTTLDPLLRRQDIPAWRARAFVYAVTGDTAEAEKAAAMVMPRAQAQALEPFLGRIAALKPAGQAAAVHFGYIPRDATPATVASAAMPAGGGFDLAARVRSVLAPRPVPAPDAVPVQAATAIAPVPAAAVPGDTSLPSVWASRPAATPAPPIAKVVAEAPSVAAAAARAPSAPLPIQAAEVVVRLPPPSLAVTTVAPPPPTVVAVRSEPPARPAAPASRTVTTSDKPVRTAADAVKTATPPAKPKTPAKKPPAPEPDRHWVQVAGGANVAGLPKAWAAVQKAQPALLKGRAAWTTHYRFTNRIMVGPFKTDEEAQAFVNKAAGGGFQTFAVTTRGAETVTRLKAD